MTIANQTQLTSICFGCDRAALSASSLYPSQSIPTMARERGRIGADAALGDIPKRLWAHAFDEMDDGPARAS